MLYEILKEQSNSKMKSIIFITLLSFSIFISCRENQEKETLNGGESPGNYSTLEIPDDNTTPTVDLSKYTLIIDSKKDRRNDAKEILKIKRKWPLAMQSLNPLEFDSILGKNFTFKGSTAFFNRAEYIKNRTTPDDWKITFVKYDNVTLQFIGDIGILSYRNHIRNENSVTKAIEIEHITWVDIYVKENGRWKIGAAHSIDYRFDK